MLRKFRRSECKIYSHLGYSHSMRNAFVTVSACLWPEASIIPRTIRVFLKITSVQHISATWVTSRIRQAHLTAASHRRTQPIIQRAPHCERHQWKTTANASSHISGLVHRDPVVSTGSIIPEPPIVEAEWTCALRSCNANTKRNICSRLAHVDPSADQA